LPVLEGAAPKIAAVREEMAKPRFSIAGLPALRFIPHTNPTMISLEAIA
jgi:hypothetical protein